MFPASLNLILLHLFMLLNLVSGLCECGYRMNNGDHYTHHLYNNFAMFNDTTNDENLITTLADWYTMGWRQDGGSEYHAIARQNERTNLWVKNGVLYMRQKGHPQGSKEPVSVAEINTRRSDILYGSFRIRNKVNFLRKAKGGSVAGFFVYYNDTQESDIELLTTDTTGSELLYTNHPAYNPKTMTIIPGTSFRHRFETPISKFQDHRLDWTPDATRFYHNNRLTREIKVNVPSHPSKIMINIWANNGSWSGPPATKDVIMAIKSIRLYFNTTSSNAGNDTEYNVACERVGGVGNGSAVCTPEELGDESMAGQRVVGWSAWSVVIVVGAVIVIVGGL